MVNRDTVLVGAGVAGVAALVVGIMLKSSTPSISGGAITLMGPTSDTVGTPVTLQAVYTDSNGQPVPNAVLYLFAYYSSTPLGSGSMPSPSQFTLIASSQTDASGTATWTFTPQQAGYYYLDASTSNTNM